MRRLLKLKLGDKIKVKYDQRRGSEEKGFYWNTYSVESSESPHPDLIVAAQRLTEHVLEIFELPEHYSTGMGIAGVTLSYGDDGAGVVVTALKTLDTCDSPAVLNTPYCLVDGTDDKPGVTEATRNAIRAAEVEALNYACDYKRAQGDLFAELKAIEAEAEEVAV